MKLTHRATVLACYNGYITQAISINLAPLLYVTFRNQFGLSLSQISGMIACNFIAQLAVDFFATRFGGKLNARFFTVLAHILTVIGLVGLSTFPFWMPPYIGLLLSAGLLGMGGGFTEVMISPLLEACPTEEKSGNMSLLHSFYCWGQAGVVLLSGLWFRFFAIDAYWRILPVLWAIIPLVGAIAFSVVPIYKLPADEENPKGNTRLYRQPAFLCFLLLMFCAGAAEMVMSQWASSFAESALGISKELGDLLGPCLFALMMGAARALYGKFSRHWNLQFLMLGGCVLCFVSYLIAAFVPVSALALAGCAMCGFAVGIFWPGLLSEAAKAFPTGGVSMFAILALAGDVGCLTGPSFAGKVADLCGNLRYAFCFALIFPTICFVALLLRGRAGKKEQR